VNALRVHPHKLHDGDQDPEKRTHNIAGRQRAVSFIFALESQVLWQVPPQRIKLLLPWKLCVNSINHLGNLETEDDAADRHAD
jgi:hypothetical protein